MTKHSSPPVTIEVIAALRVHLTTFADVWLAGEIAEVIANDAIARINAIDAYPVNQATNMMAQVLVANALLRTAADWWASGLDERVTPEAALATMRSFTEELPDGLSGSVFNVEDQS